MENKKTIFTGILILFLLTIIIIPINAKQTNTSILINETQNNTIKESIPIRTIAIPSHIRQINLEERLQNTNSNLTRQNIKRIIIDQKREDFKTKNMQQIQNNNNKFIIQNRNDLKYNIREKLRNQDIIINTKDRLKAEDPRRFPHIERQHQKEIREKANARNR